MATVAEVLLQIRAEGADQVRRELQQAAGDVEKFSKTEGEATAEVDDSPARKTLRDLAADFAKLARERVTATIDADATEARAELSRLAAQSVNVDVEVEADTREADRSVRGLIARLASIRDERVEVDVDTEPAERALARLSDRLRDGGGGFRRLAQGIRDTGTVLIGLLVPGILSLMGTLAPLASTLAGAALAAGGLGLALGGVLAPVMLLVTAAMERFKRTSALVGTAANDLKRQFQDFAGVLRQAVAPAAGAVLEGLTGALKTIAPLVTQLAPSFERLGGAVRRSIGVMATQLVAAGPLFERLVAGASQAVGPLTRIFGNLGRVVLNLAVAAMPFLIDALRELAKETRGWVKATADTGQIRELFRGFMRDLKDVGEFAREAGRVVLALFNAFRGPGRDAANDLTELVRQTADWAESVRGQREIRAFFSSVFFAIKDLGDFIRTYGPAIGAFFVTFGRAATVLMQALNRLSPEVTKVVGALAGLAVFGKAIGAVFSGLVLPAVRGLASVFQFVGQRVIFAEGALGRIIGLLSRFAGPVGAAVFAFSVLRRVMGDVRAALTILSPAISGFVFVIQGWIKAVEAVVPFLADLGRTLVNGVANGIKAAGGALKGAATWIKDQVVDGVKRQVGAIVNVGEWVTARIRDGIKAVGGFIANAATWVKNQVVNGIHAQLEAILNVGRWITARVRDGIKAVAGFLANGAGWIKDQVVNGVRQQVDAIVHIGEWITARVRDGIKSLPGALLNAADWVKDRFVEGIRQQAGAIANIGEWVARQVAEGIRNLPGALADAAQWAAGRFLNGLKDLAGAFYSAGKWVVEQFAAGIKAAAGAALDAAKAVANAVKGILPGSEPKDPSSPLRGLSKTGEAFVANFSDGIRAAIPTAMSQLSRLTSGMAAQLAVSATMSPAVAAPTVSVPAAIAGSLAERPELRQYFSIETSGYGPQSDATEALSHLATLLRGRGGLG